DRLRVTYDVPDALLDLPVPTLAVHTLVENAVRHGVSRRPGAGTVAVCAARDGDRLVVRVDDDGPGLGAHANGTHANGARTNGARANGSGVGLANTRARLAARYGEAASVSVVDRVSGAV